MLGNYTTVFPRCKAKNAVFSGKFHAFYPGYYILGMILSWHDFLCLRTKGMGRAGASPRPTKRHKALSFMFLALGHRQLVTAVVVGVFCMTLHPRRRKLCILRPASSGRAHSLRRSSFPICTHCVGLQMGSHIGSKACVTYTSDSGPPPIHHSGCYMGFPHGL